MNAGGVLMREMGMDAFFDRLLSDVLTPTAHRLHLLPPDATLDSHKTFTVVYQHPMVCVCLCACVCPSVCLLTVDVRCVWFTPCVCLFVSSVSSIQGDVDLPPHFDNAVSD